MNRYLILTLLAASTVWLPAKDTPPPSFKKSQLTDQFWSEGAAFGDFNRVISASPVRLAAVKGVGDAVINELKIVEAAAQRMMRARVMPRIPAARPKWALRKCANWRNQKPNKWRFTPSI